MKKIIVFCGLLTVVFTTNILGQSITLNPEEILLKADEAYKKIQTIEYSHSREISFTRMPIPQMWVNIKEERLDSKVLSFKSNSKYEITGTMSKFGAVPEPFAVSFDGQVTRFLNHSDKTVFLLKDLPREQMFRFGSNHQILKLGVDFMNSNSFQGLLKQYGAGASYLGQEEVDGELCHIIAIHTRKGDIGESGSFSPPNTWYLSVKDFLPRMFKNGEIQKEKIKIIQVNQPFRNSDFTIKTPEGFSESLVTEGYKPVALLIVGAKAPDWVLPDAVAKKHSFANFRGKVVVLDFWATWCAPCIKSMPKVQALHQKYGKKGVSVLGISVRETGNAAHFMKKRGFTYKNLIGTEAMIEQYGAAVLPLFYIIGKDGTILYSAKGYSPTIMGEIEKIIESQLSK